MRKILELTIAALLLTSCGGSEGWHTGHDPLPDSHRVSGEQAVRLVISGALLVDVSDRVSYYGRHVRGAHNIPHDELLGRIEELPRDRPIIVYSRDGSHAAEADLVLRARGFDVHLLGSFDQWAHQGS